MPDAHQPQEPPHMTVLEVMKSKQRRRRLLTLGVVLAIFLVAFGSVLLAKMLSKEEKSDETKVYYGDEETQVSVDATSDPSTATATPRIEVTTSGVSHKTDGTSNAISVGAIVYNPSPLTAVNVEATFDVKAQNGTIVASGKAVHRSVASKSHAAMSTVVKVPAGVALEGVVVNASAKSANTAVPQKFEFSNLVYTSSSPAVFTGEIKNASEQIARQIQIQCVVLTGEKPVGGATGTIEELGPGASTKIELREGLISGVRPTNSVCYATSE